MYTYHGMHGYEHQSVHGTNLPTEVYQTDLDVSLKNIQERRKQLIGFPSETTNVNITSKQLVTLGIR